MNAIEIARRRVAGIKSNQIDVTYLVQLDNVAQDIDDAKNHVSGLGAPAGFHLDNLSSDRQGRNPLWYQVVATYLSNQTPNGAWDADPLDRPSLLSASYEEWTEPYFKDSTGALVINSAGDRFDPLPQKKNGTLVLSIVKNIANYPAPFYDSIKFTTHAGALTLRGTTYPAGTLLFLPAAAQEVYETVNGVDFHYYATTFRLATDTHLHRQDFEDRGFNELDAGGDVRPVLDATGSRVTSPWTLDGSGHAVSYLPGATPAVKTSIPYPSQTWGLDFA